MLVFLLVVFKCQLLPLAVISLLGISVFIGSNVVVDGGGGDPIPCTTRWYGSVANKAPIGYKKETKALAMANCNVTKGEFVPVKSGDVKWLYDEDPVTKERTYLDLDGWNEQLKIGLEYNGEQHYYETFGENDYTQLKYMHNDNAKAAVLQKKGYSLIIVPYFIQKGKLENYIRSRLDDIGALKPINKYTYIPLRTEPYDSEERSMYYDWKDLADNISRVDRINHVIYFKNDWDPVYLSEEKQYTQRPRRRR